MTVRRCTSRQSSERLTDAEMKAPASLLELAIDQQVRNRIELISDVYSNRSDRRSVPQPRPDGVPQIAQVHAPR